VVDKWVVVGIVVEVLDVVELEGECLEVGCFVVVDKLVEIEKEGKRLKKLEKQAKQQLSQLSSFSPLVNIEDQVHTSSDTDTEPTTPIVGNSFEDIPFDNHIAMNHTPPHNTPHQHNRDANTPPQQQRQPQHQEPLIDVPQPWNHENVNLLPPKSNGNG